MTQDNLPRCRHHADQAAHWHCPACRVDLCTDCKPYAEQLPIRVVCPLCGATMRELRVGISPWRETAGLLARPALSTSLTLTVALAALAWLLPPGPVRLLAAVPLLVVLGGWLGLIARNAGEDRPRAASARDLLDFDELEFALRALGLALPLAAVATLGLADGSIAWPGMTVAVLAVALPAALAATLIHDRLGAALRPDLLGDVVAVTRADYLPPAFATLMASGFAFPAVLLPAGSLAAVASTFIACTLAIIAARLLGRVLYRHRRWLGYHAGVAPIERPRTPPPSVYEPALLAADSDSLRAAGRTRAARLHLGAALTRYPDDEALTRRFDRLIHETASRRDFRNHLARRLKRLVGNGQFAPAADLWQRYSHELGNWIPRDAETRYQLGLELDDRGEHSTAFRMLIGLSPDDPGFERASEAWLESARILADHLGDPHKARELSDYVARRDPAVLAQWRQRRGSIPGDPATGHAEGLRNEAPAHPDAPPRAPLARSGEIG